MKELELELFYQLLFIISMFSACVFGMAMVSILSKMKDIFQQSQKWFAIKLAVLVYLTVFSIFYLALLLDRFKIIQLTISIENIRDRFEYGVFIMPFIIKLFTSILVLSFFDEMKSLYVGISNSKDNDEKNLV
jgi:uncharacterized membrane protein